MSHLDSEIRLQLFSSAYPKADVLCATAPKAQSEKTGIRFAKVYALLLAVFTTLR